MKYSHALGLVGVLASCVPAPVSTSSGIGPSRIGSTGRVVNVVAELPQPKELNPRFAQLGFHTQGVVLASLSQAEVSIQGFGMPNVLSTIVNVSVGPGPTYTVTAPIANVPEGRNRLIRVQGRDAQGIPMPGVQVEAIIDINGSGNALVSTQTTVAARVYRHLAAMANKSANRSLYAMLTNLSYKELQDLVDGIAASNSVVDNEQVDDLKLARQIAQAAGAKPPEFFFTNFTPLPPPSDFSSFMASSVNLPVVVDAPANFPHLDNPGVTYSLSYADRSSPVFPLGAPPYSSSAQSVTGVYLKTDLPLSLKTMQGGTLHTRLLRTPTFDASNVLGFPGVGSPIPMRPVKFSPINAPPGAKIKVEIDTSMTPGSVGTFFGGTQGEARLENQTMALSSWNNSIVEFFLPDALSPGVRHVAVTTPNRNLTAELFNLNVLQGPPEIYRAYWTGTQVIVEGKHFSGNSPDNQLSFGGVPTLATAAVGPPDTLSFSRASAIAPGTLFQMNIGGVSSHPYKFRRIAFQRMESGTQWEIFGISEDGNNPVNLTNHPAFDRSPAWSPNGSKIAFVSSRDGPDEIYVMNANGTLPTNVSNNAATDQDPSWTPDSAKLVFSSDRDGDDEIWIMNANGASPIQLTFNTSMDRHPAVSPDGTKIAFVSDRDGNDEIYVMNIDGTGVVRLTQDGILHDSGSDTHPAWSPDGSKIAYQSNRDGDWEIYVMNADGSGHTQLTTNSGYIDERPHWTPDGKRIAFATNRDAGNLEIYFMAADGSIPSRVTNHTDTDTAPFWGP